MIKETTKKINFSPAYLAGNTNKVDEETPKVVVTKKYGRLVFASKALTEMNMVGKFIKLFYEPQRNIIGWQLRDVVSQPEMKIWKPVQPQKSTGVFSIPVTAILRDFKNKLEKDSYKVPVQKYRETGKTSEYNGQVFYFVEVKDEANLEVIKNENDSKSQTARVDSPEGAGGGTSTEGTERENVSQQAGVASSVANATPLQNQA